MTGSADFSKGRVLVLLGGLSHEREVSLVSGRACADSLARQGWSVEEHDWRGDLTALVALLTSGLDLVFNALHGTGGEDGQMQGLLALSGVPTTHSGVLSSALAMEKNFARELLRYHDITIPEGEVLPAPSLARGDPRPRPYVVKPLNDGSSVGVQIVRAGDPVPTARPQDERVLVEEYIPGRELTVTVLEERALEVTELRVKSGFYDYNAKYGKDGAHHLVPAPIPAPVREEAMHLAERVHECLGCRCISRSDFRWDENGTLSHPGRLYFLEVNTQPGMTPNSLAPEQARFRGLSFDELVAKIAGAAR